LPLDANAGRPDVSVFQADDLTPPYAGEVLEKDSDEFVIASGEQGGPPKNSNAVRHVRLPRFLVNLLSTSLATHAYPIVFPGARGSFQRRSNFNRRAWTPAVAGNVTEPMQQHLMATLQARWESTQPLPPGGNVRRLHDAA
jgi:hypothetical protein